MSRNHFLICAVFLATILAGVDGVQIGNTALFTDTNYYISGATVTGFNRLAAATIGREIEVQLDDNAERRAMYAPSSRYSQFAKWTFEHVVSTSNMPLVIMRLAGYRLVVPKTGDGMDLEVPYFHTAKLNVTLTKSDEYSATGGFCNNAVWEIIEETKEAGTTYLFKNFATQHFLVPYRYRPEDINLVYAERWSDFKYKIETFEEA